MDNIFKKIINIFHFVLSISIDFSYLEKELLEHPGVEDVAVRGLSVHNIGKVKFFKLDL